MNQVILVWHTLTDSFSVSFTSFANGTLNSYNPFTSREESAAFLAPSTATRSRTQGAFKNGRPARCALYWSSSICLRLSPLSSFLSGSALTSRFKPFSLVLAAATLGRRLSSVLTSVEVTRRKYEQYTWCICEEERKMSKQPKDVHYIANAVAYQLVKLP